MSIFREKALVKLKSPEQLDEALRIIPRKNRIAIYATSGVLVFALLWGGLGSLPETGRGQGILLTPNTVVPIQAKADGQVGQWFVKVGDVVEPGQVLGILEQPRIVQDLEQAEAKLEEFRGRNRILGDLRTRYTELERGALARKRTVLETRIGYLEGYISRTRALTERVTSSNEELLAIQRENLVASRESKVRMSEELRQRLQAYERLRAEQLAAEETVSNNRRSYQDSRVNLRDMDLQLQELELKKVQMAESYLNTQNTIANHENTLTDLRLQLREIEKREAEIEKQASETAFRDENEIEDIERTIERHRTQLQREREIRAELGGRILEVTAADGSVVTSGQRLAQLDARKPSDDLIAIAYFTDKIGKQLEPGMTVRVSPSTVSQKRHGSMVGTITSVSDFPVTTDAVINYVGNTEVAERLTAGEHQIEVFAALKIQPDAPSGYAWTSVSGPDVSITAGTTADVWVTYERRAPISFVSPVLRKWSGL